MIVLYKVDALVHIIIVAYRNFYKEYLSEITSFVPLGISYVER
jgi:hypothetical protein